ncbi:hypothetical protein PM082_003002 [Marasmius tenuissimus]|nr:hypothetical protein PM082_003002 [Marasmius tenuissimus]
MTFVLLLFFVLPLSLVEAALRNVTIVSPDSSLRLESGWLASTNQLSGDLFLTFNIVNRLALTVTLPEWTQRVIYIGLKRVGGSQYGLCPNCEDNTSSIILVDGNDSSLESDDKSTPTEIFSQDFDCSRRNTLTLFNLADDQFSSSSTITFDSLVVTIDDGCEAPTSSDTQTNTTSTPPSSTTPSATSTPPSSVSSQSNEGRQCHTLSYLPMASSPPFSGNATATQSTSGPSSSATSDNSQTTSSNNTRSSVIALIVVFTVVPITSLAVGLYFCLRRRAQKRSSRLSDFFMYNHNPVGRRFPSYRASQPVYAPRVSTAQSGPLGSLAAAGRTKPPPRPRHYDPSPYSNSYPQNSTIQPVASNRRTRF